MLERSLARRLKVKVRKMHSLMLLSNGIGEGAMFWGFREG
jgi:hypothetical protein